MTQPRDKEHRDARDGAICAAAGFGLFDRRRSSPGWPDLALAHPTRCLLLLAEIKTETGRVKPEQEQWLNWLNAAGIDARLWRPSD